MSSPAPSRLDISVILPVFNERGHLDAEIGRIHSSLESSGYTYEIIVVDDGSTDGSSERLRELEGIRLIQFQTNRGSGSARKYGTLQARGRVVRCRVCGMNIRIPEAQVPGAQPQTAPSEGEGSKGSAKEQ